MTRPAIQIFLLEVSITSTTTTVYVCTTTTVYVCTVYVFWQILEHLSPSHRIRSTQGHIKAMVLYPCPEKTTKSNHKM